MIKGSKHIGKTEIRQKFGALTFLLFMACLVACGHVSAQITNPHSHFARIHVNTGRTLGSAAAIRDFVCVEGLPIEAPESVQWERAAWRELGFTTSSIQLLNGDVTEYGPGISVIRDPARGKKEAGLGPKHDLFLDARGFDVCYGSLRKDLGRGQAVFSINMTPRTMSVRADKTDSYTYGPRDYHEWAEVVTAAVRHLGKAWGVKAPIITLFGEPESQENWKGLGGDYASGKTLEDYIALYVSTYYAVKDADPSAILLGPISGVYSSTMAKEISGGAVAWGLDDFVRELRNYNTNQPQWPVKIEAIGWQGYNWDKSRRLWNGVFHVRKVLRQHGFNENIPQILVGWNLGWTLDPPPEQHEQASHLVANVIDQLNPGGRRGVRRAFYYTWNLEPGQDPASSKPPVNRDSIVITKHGAIDFGAGAKTFPSNRNCKRATYAAFQMLSSMSEGNFVPTQVLSSGRDPYLQTATVVQKKGQRMRTVIANNSEKAYTLAIKYDTVPFQGVASVRLQRIDARHSNNCLGLEAGIAKSYPVTERGLELIGLDVPKHSLVLVTAEAAQ